MSLAIVFASLCLLVSAALLFAWPVYARGFDDLRGFWRHPGNRTLALIFTLIIAIPIALANGPLAAGGPMVQLEPRITTSA